MNTAENVFKRRLSEGVQQVGIFATIADPALIELLAGWEFDWILIDTEHAPTELPGVVDRLRVLDGTHTEAIVRPAWSDAILFKRLLDVGARTLLVPSVSTPEEAAQAVAFTRYAPEGMRGVTSAGRAARYGQDRDYLAAAADQLCVIAQVETALGLQHLEAIATTAGIDAIFIGPSDLAASLGHLGDTQHPEVQAAVDEAFATLRRLGVPSGYLTLDVDEGRRRIAAGVDFVGIATDTSIANAGVADLEARIGHTVRRAP